MSKEGSGHKPYLGLGRLRRNYDGNVKRKSQRDPSTYFLYIYWTSERQEPFLGVRENITV